MRIINKFMLMTIFAVSLGQSVFAGERAEIVMNEIEAMDVVANPAKAIKKLNVILYRLDFASQSQRGRAVLIANKLLVLDSRLVNRFIKKMYSKGFGMESVEEIASDSFANEISTKNFSIILNESIDDVWDGYYFQENLSLIISDRDFKASDMYYAENGKKIGAKKYLESLKKKSIDTRVIGIIDYHLNHM